MASSVSSERAFSSAGITLSKRRNRLKGDIVEALQCLKCLYHGGLIFREIVSSSEIEEELESGDCVDAEAVSQDVVDDADKFSWDQIALGDDEDVVML
jgi:hypothetical protein